MAYCPPSEYYPYAQPSDFIDYGSKFVCGKTCCTIAPTAPTFGLGLFGSPCSPYSSPSPCSYPSPCSASSACPFPPNPYGPYYPPAPCSPYFGSGPACSGLMDSFVGPGFDSCRRGPQGWVEVGWVSAENLPPHKKRKRPEYPTFCFPRSESAFSSPSSSCHGSDDEGGKKKRKSQKGKGQSGTKKQRGIQTRQASYFMEEGDDCFDDGEEEYYGGEGRACGGPVVQCRVRRYRLYARPFYGWCRGFDAFQWQYAVVEEGIPKCDAILIVLHDNPRFFSNKYGGGGGSGGSLARQQLQGGDLVRVPGEHCPFRVHLYADEQHY